MNEVTVKYVLYSHYGANERSDFESFLKGMPPDKLQGVQHLEQHFRGLKELLTSPGHEGLLVLFYAPGFAEFLKGIADRKSQEDLINKTDSLRFATVVANCVRKKLEAAQLSQRVRFVTSIDLGVIFGQVHTIFSENFRKYFIGAAEGLRYDCPKIPEAILRLRLLGNGVPVLRLDHDVIFRFGGEKKVVGDLGLFKAVACSSRAYHLRLADPTVSTFLFSASYNSRDLREPSVDVDCFHAWSRAFATRVYPALVVDMDDIRKIQMLPKDQRNSAWDDYVRKHLNESLASRFFGLRGKGLELQADGFKGLTSIGAHPFHSVISGALLCLSEGAILDLPPFSNFHSNVMWIDDHLKYSLHRAMHHFTSGETLNLEPGLSDARLDNVIVTKARPAVSGLLEYVFGTYLPTLLWGTIVESWITADPILKCRVSSLNVGQRKRWRMAKKREQESPLPRSMLRALRVGHFSGDDEDILRSSLQKRAVQRIEEVRQLWANLRDGDNRTFAACWAEGTVKTDFHPKYFAGCKNHLWEGIAPGRSLTEPILSLEDLSTSILNNLNMLIEDAVTYVHWTLDWPKFVQIVRSVRQGTFMGDLSQYA